MLYEFMQQYDDRFEDLSENEKNAILDIEKTANIIFEKLKDQWYIEWPIKYYDPLTIYKDNDKLYKVKSYIFDFWTWARTHYFESLDEIRTELINEILTIINENNNFNI